MLFITCPSGFSFGILKESIKSISTARPSDLSPTNIYKYNGSEKRTMETLICISLLKKIEAVILSNSGAFNRIGVYFIIPGIIWNVIKCIMSYIWTEIPSIGCQSHHREFSYFFVGEIEFFKGKKSKDSSIHKQQPIQPNEDAYTIGISNLFYVLK